MTLRRRMAHWLHWFAERVAGPPQPITAAQMREAVKALEKYNAPPDDCPMCGRQVYYWKAYLG